MKNELLIYSVFIVCGHRCTICTLAVHWCMIRGPLKSSIRLKLLFWTASNMNPLSSPSKLAQRPQADVPERVEEKILSSPPRLQLYRESPQKNSSKSPMKSKGSGLLAQIYLINPDHVAVRSPFNLVSFFPGYTSLSWTVCTTWSNVKSQLDLQFCRRMSTILKHHTCTYLSLYFLSGSNYGSVQTHGMKISCLWFEYSIVRANLRSVTESLLWSCKLTRVWPVSFCRKWRRLASLCLEEHGMLKKGEDAHMSVVYVQIVQICLCPDIEKPLQTQAEGFCCLSHWELPIWGCLGFLASGTCIE